MVKVLYLQSMYNLVDDQAEKEIHDKISFMNFLDYPDLLPDARTIWLFRERLSKTAKDHDTTIDLSRRGIIVYKGIRDTLAMIQGE
jgi:IS5 family transposase